MLCVYHLFIEISELDHRHHHHQVFVVTNIKEKINGGIDKEVPFTYLLMGQVIVGGRLYDVTNLIFEFSGTNNRPSELNLLH